MSLTPLNFNSNGKPEPTEDNTITLREYTGGPIAQFDAEQNFINFKGRVNDLLNSVSNLTSTVSSNQSSLQTEISNLSTTLTNSINSSNAAQDATIASNLATLNTAIANQESSTAAQLASLDNSVSAHVSPVGSIMAFAGTTTPAYWLVCDGRSLVKSTYQALFDAIGYTYGGSGANFNVPNLLGRVIAGTGTTGRFSGWGMGSTGGAENIVLTTSQIPSHDHVWYGENDDARASGGGAGYGGKRSNVGVRNPQNVPYGKPFYTTPTGGGAGHSNIQPTMTMHYIIHSGV
jgi:microcystin-dependent protein